MNLQNIIAHESHLRRLSVRLCPLLEADACAALERATFIAAEMRHFAVCWEDASEMSQDDAFKHRRELQGRLMQIAIPEPT
jgi:hypothetical protein